MPAPPGPAVRVAASTLTRPLLTGPRRPGRVLGVFPTAVYVGFGAELVAVETADGLRLPRAATLAAPSSAHPLRTVRGDDDARVGEGHLDVGPLAFKVVRWWSPRRPRTATNCRYDDARLTAADRLLAPLSADLEVRLDDLTRALATPGALGVRSATTALVGLGEGLTPQGDDLLAGFLVALAAVPATRLLASTLGDEVDRMASRTTALSAALLRDAADGFAVPALIDLVDALQEADHADLAAIPTTHRALADVVVRLLAVGHTSGAALAHGAVAATRLRASMHAEEEVA